MVRVLCLLSEVFIVRFSFLEIETLAAFVNPVGPARIPKLTNFGTCQYTTDS